MNERETVAVLLARYGCTYAEGAGIALCDTSVPVAAADRGRCGVGGRR